MTGITLLLRVTVVQHNVSMSIDSASMDTEEGRHTAYGIHK